MKKALYLSLSLACAAGAQAELLHLDLSPPGTTPGVGLSPLNEVIYTPSAGAGNEIGGGITFDTSSMMLTLNIGYGSAFGFTDLTAPAFSWLLHGPATPTETAPVLFDLQSLHTFAANPSRGGMISGSLALSAAHASDLLGGLDYINIYTPGNLGGEIRGQLVVVRDNIPPTLRCPQIVVANCTGVLTPVAYTVTAVDDAGGPVPVICMPPSGTGFRLGQSNVVCTATDSAGLSSRCTFTVSVVDEVPPQLACPSNIVVSSTSPHGEVVTFAVRPYDDCGIASFACVPDSGSVFPCGSTTVTCRALDWADNASSCSFRVTVVCQTNKCPVARITSIALCTGTRTNTFISANGANVCLVLDGSLSTDPDGDLLIYRWLVDGMPFASGVRITNCFPIGSHTITLQVDDGRCVSSTHMPAELLTACEAVEDLIAKVDGSNLARQNKRPFIATLKAACASFEPGSFNSGTNQLGAFINKVRAQLGRTNPDETALFTECAQNILDALNCTEAGGHGG